MLSPAYCVAMAVLALLQPDCTCLARTQGPHIKGDNNPCYSTSHRHYSYMPQPLVKEHLAYLILWLALGPNEPWMLEESYKLTGRAGDSVYGEKRVSVQNPGTEPGTIDKTEYRVWNPFRSKLAGTGSGLL